MTIERLGLLGWDPSSGQLELEVACSAGTYIRSLARDLGESLGCGGCLAHLRRTGALGFGLEQAVGLEQLEQAEHLTPTLALEATAAHGVEGVALGHQLPLKAIVRGYSYSTMPITWRNRRTGVPSSKSKKWAVAISSSVYTFGWKSIFRGETTRKR